MEPCTSASAITARSPESSAFARLANVILDPRAAFQCVAAAPTWAVAFAAVVMLRLGSLLAFYGVSTNAGKLLLGVLFQVVTLGPLLIMLALLLRVCSLCWRAHVGWGAAFSIAVHVYFAYTLATIAIASISGALLPSTVDVSPRDPPFTNLGFLASGDRPLLNAVLTEIDVRSAYALMLVSEGVRAADPDAGGRRAACVAGTCLLVLVVRQLGLAAFRG